MACQWYTFTSVRIKGIPFMAKNVPTKIMEKYNVIRIPIPIHEYLNTSTFLWKKKQIMLFCTDYDEIFNTDDMIGEWNNVNEYDMIDKIKDDDVKWFCDNGANYIYICVTKMINTTNFDVPGPHLLPVRGISFMFEKEGLISPDNMQLIDKIYNPNGFFRGIPSELAQEVCDITISTTNGTDMIVGLDDLVNPF